MSTTYFATRKDDNLVPVSTPETTLRDLAAPIQARHSCTGEWQMVGLRTKGVDPSRSTYAVFGFGSATARSEFLAEVVQRTGETLEEERVTYASRV